MKVLVVGSGGREHALVRAFSRSGLVDEVLAAPGNPGMLDEAERVEVDASDPYAVASLADERGVELLVVGPEAPLVAGVVDACEARGVPAFGPGRAGARLEGSKGWMKELLVGAGVPTARHASFAAGEEDEALRFLEELPGFYVIKADGLAGGKGVTVTESFGEARDAVRSYLSGDAFGEAGTSLVIEEGLTGPELSLLVLCDGTRSIPLAPARDHKRIGDGDTGPNTGGMGAYSPVPLVNEKTVGRIVEEAIEPTLAALRARDIAYRGVLYAGLMLTPEGPKILEYNVRFGDPEAQAVIPRLSSDLALHCLEAAEGRLRSDVAWRSDACVTVVLASEGYPASSRTGDVIRGVEDAEGLDDVAVFHAGTELDGEGRLRTAGGRVLGVSALGGNLRKARERAYAAAGKISWRGMQYRGDVAEGVR